MRRPEPLWILLALAVVATAAGCRKPEYVKTSLAGQRGFTRTAAEVHVSDKHKGTTAQVQRNVLLAQQYLANGDVAAAERAADKALDQAPNSVDAHSVMGSVLARKGDDRGAGEHFLKAVELAPGNPHHLNNYGLWLCGQGKARESLAVFDKALLAARDQPTLLANGAVCAEQAGDEARAERDLRKAVALDPANAKALGAMARREYRAGNAFSARAFSERRLAAAPADPQALLLASQIEEKLGDTAAAARYVARLKMEFPGAPEARGSTTGDGVRQ
jgi:type IV pilus assembly protein PilF